MQNILHADLFYYTLCYMTSYLKVTLQSEQNASGFLRKEFKSRHEPTI